MESQELIYRVVKAIQLNSELAPTDQPIPIDPWGQYLNGIQDIQLDQIFRKLESDEKVIKIGYIPEWNGANHYLIYVSPTFKEYAEKTIQSFEESIQQQTSQQETTSPPATRSEALIKITYSDKNREITLNDIFFLYKPDFASENDLVFNYLFRNPNRKVTIKEIEETANIKIKKTPHEIIGGLGFKHDLRKVFFSVSADTFIFHNPISPEHLKEIGLSKIKISAKSPPKSSEES